MPETATEAATHEPARTLILGSSSRYRAALLERLGLPFSQSSPDIDETPGPEELPADLVLRLAAAKAEAIAERTENALIIASDQVASIDDQILGKPGTAERACEQLSRLSGRLVTFYTSLHLLDTASGRQVSELDITEVQFRELGVRQIEHYVAAERPLDCAGAFKSEGLGIALFEHIRCSDPNALIGLPLIRLCTALAVFGQPVLGAP